MDKAVETSLEPSVSETQETSSAPVIDSMQSDGAATEDTIASGTSLSRSKFSSPPQGVVIVSQDPVARLTLWLPGQVQEAEHSENLGQDDLTVQLQASDADSNDLPEPQPSTTDQESPLNTPTNEVGDQSADELGSEAHMSDLNLLTLVSGWVIPPRLEKAAIAEESQRKMRLGRSGASGTEAPQEADAPLPAQMTVNVLNQNDFDQVRAKRADAAVMPQDGTNDARPILRSKLQFSKGTDGSQTLSYEEEVVRQQEGKGVISRFEVDGIKRKQEPIQKGLRSTFLDLLR